MPARSEDEGLRRREARRRTTRAARLRALSAVLSPVVQASLRRTTRRLVPELELGPAERRQLERDLTRWVETWLHVSADSDGSGALDPRVLLELELTPKEASMVLTELRVSLTRALVSAQGVEPGDKRITAQLETLNRCFDEALCDLLQTSAGDARRRLAREEKLVVVGQLVASLIHELRNPLSVIDTSMLLVERRAKRGQSVELHVGRARSQVDRSRKIIDDLLELLHERPLLRRPVGLSELIEDGLEALGPERSRVRFDAPDDLPSVEVDAGQIEQVIVDLLTQVLETTASESPVRLRAWSNGAEVVLEVAEEGLEAAWGAASKSNGAGAELALSRRLAEQNYGRLEASLGGSHGGPVYRLVLPEPARPSEPLLPPTDPEA